MSGQNDYWWRGPVAPLDAEATQAAAERQAQLIKPPGALGKLESLAIRLAGMQGRALPGVERVRIVLFAGDHGVVAEAVSAFPQSVTTAMLNCFAGGGSAISVLARELGADLEVLNLGTVEDVAVPGVIDARLGPGTANFTAAPAMSEHQVARALNVGRHAAERARLADTDILIGGEMGIGNTTSATALACALLGEAAENLAGPGAGLDGSGVRHKIEVIRRALDFHAPHLSDPLEVLRRLGGYEIAGLAGAYIAAARMGLPVLVDGYICTAAALVAERLCPGCRVWFIFGHASAEPGHVRMLSALQADALLDLGLRLGEGSGAAVALPLLRLACRLHAGMATFAEAGVAGKTP
ncbi:nicotinate-nucleotide--dimethylbenzimidazole phosphoribosyltransferase [Methylococcus sp. EFPC2]|uniref:nicotinate-nucleotide--dimethylbenzimidazole phosphoribosyltransferase n=1 Tax=Methylococcus sp. EFPC2 TaxID=2812648 RepID=UPI001967531D|nr:nicotinate-nucleotide--dimethylbenzimidazole phosphoribosyltransferase [Methylococcus sp. EFPC2]QSA97907.1 nicotinate-nucleotide--dimethylbenzimidazole phosphoribosyltransferase [Methylococcus sp. EFPC2]